MIGHRGAAAHAPENTMLSFERALAFNVDMIELDVHICSTGELVVIHDNSVDRTTNGTGKVADLTISEIRKLDAGSGEKIPTLVEVLDRYLDKVGLNIELKGKGSSEPVGDLLKTYLKKYDRRSDDLLISSFRPDELLDFPGSEMDVQIGFIFEDHLEMGLDFAAEIGAWSIHPRMDLLDPGSMMGARSRDLKVLPWTINDKKWLSRMIELGVDGIFTDDPTLFSVQRQ